MSNETYKMTSGEYVPIEMHKVRVVQKLNLLPIEKRLKAIEDAGYNTFLLQNRDVFMDMLTDSGTNAMSDRQIASMMIADDAYAGSESFNRLQEAVEEVLGTGILPSRPIRDVLLSISFHRPSSKRAISFP